MEDSTGSPSTNLGATTEVGTETGPSDAVEAKDNQQEIVDQISIKLLEETQRNGQLENNNLELKRKNAELWRQVMDSRRMKEESDREVEKLSTEMEDLSATLFDEANMKVKEANVNADNYRQRNERLIQSLKQKDEDIELLKSELAQLKGMIGKMTENFQVREQVLQAEAEESRAASRSGVQLGNGAFSLDILQQYNGEVIYAPLYNQLRFDLHGLNQFRRALIPHKGTQPFNIRDTSFFKALLIEEIEPVLRLDLAPGVRIYQRRSFIKSMMDHKVTIEPLSASTESWKSKNLEEAATRAAEHPELDLADTTADTTAEDMKMFKYDTNLPVADAEKCAICGESRSQMNFARLYKMRIKDIEYPLCIACADKLRVVVQLLKKLKGIEPTAVEGEVLAHWCELVPLRTKLYYTKLGLWGDSDEYGQSYGWKNIWLGHIATEELGAGGSNSELQSQIDPEEKESVAATEAVEGEDGVSETTKEISEAEPKLEVNGEDVEPKLDADDEVTREADGKADGEVDGEADGKVPKLAPPHKVNADTTGETSDSEVDGEFTDAID